MNIILIGYMGSGKSYIGRKLARELNYGYLDLDDYLEQKEKKTISEIFSDHGEIYFRKKESAYIKELLDGNKNYVISLGGGTPCFAGNMEAIKNADHTKSIYLKTGIKTLLDRLYEEKEHRPLIAHLKEKDDLEDFIRKHLFERSFYYNQADIIINTDDYPVDKILSDLKEKILS